REATAGGRIYMKKETLDAILEMRIKKGNVFEVARVAAIMAVKRTSDLIPMCHPLAITAAEVDFMPDTDNAAVDIFVTARLTGKTGVEMEALTGVSVAALTIYDMCKAADKEMVISDIRLLKKSGGKSGDFIREKV
ncbi:MAG: cyclic pyranopterin monophosphate synthase MoaC, partial [Mucispirillum sp.]|nr:cyclic pyranopterin monophosphate synthase MoaC [Mucispirillum sp.]